jgi:hypothetical protein
MTGLGHISHPAACVRFSVPFQIDPFICRSHFDFCIVRPPQLSYGIGDNFPCFIGRRWSLSPAYDLNPVPEMDRARVSKIAISESQEEPTIAGAQAAATRFGLKAIESRKILREVFTSVAGWRKTGRQLRLK